MKVKPSSSKRHFRLRRRNTMPIINACVAQMNDIIAETDLDKHEEHYYAREDDAPIDWVFSLVSKHTFNEPN